eukprot:5322453-Pyramimonas_sp.AAC.1
MKDRGPDDAMGIQRTRTTAGKRERLGRARAPRAHMFGFLGKARREKIIQLCSFNVTAKMSYDSPLVGLPPTDPSAQSAGCGHGWRRKERAMHVH